MKVKLSEKVEKIANQLNECINQEKKEKFVESILDKFVLELKNYFISNTGLVNYNFSLEIVLEEEEIIYLLLKTVYYSPSDIKEDVANLLKKDLFVLQNLFDIKNLKVEGCSKVGNRVFFKFEIYYSSSVLNLAFHLNILEKTLFDILKKFFLDLINKNLEIFEDYFKQKEKKEEDKNGNKIK